MIATDTNILVYAHRADSEWNDRAKACVSALAEGRVAWGLPWPCVHEFLATVTRPGIFRPPSTLEVAIEQVDAWLESPVAVLLTETFAHWELLKDLLRQGQVRGPMVHDARVASLCLAHGVTEFWTADRDFSRFPELPARNPLLG
ncbi:MAG: PIN domain-containing protein [Acidobacteria bacterium]|nr:PIN domain-containing protein [Acidobacteriota bacterium]